MEIRIALTAFHAFSGSLNRKCKVRTLIPLEKNESTQRKFSELNAITEETSKLWKVWYELCIQKRDSDLWMNCI